MRILACFLILSCSTHASDSSTLRMRITSDFDSMDWNTMLMASSGSVLNNIMEGLFELDDHFVPRSRLAESFSLSPDRRTYTFKIRKDVLWSDGKPLRAQDFIDSWRRLLDPRNGSPYAYLLYKINGAEKFNSTPTGDFSTVGAKTTDDHTLVVTLDSPCESFLQILSIRVTFPVRAELVKQYGLAWTNPDKLVVLGPYTVAVHERDKRYLLKRNNRYYGPRPAIDEIEIRIIPEQRVAVELFKKGELDYILNVSLGDSPELRGSPALQIKPSVTSQYLFFNTRQYPFSLPKARQALVMAIDRSKLAAIRPDSTRAASLVPPLILPDLKIAELPFDPLAARAMFRDLAIDPKTLPKLEIYGVRTAENKLVMEFIAKELKENLGIDSTVELFGLPEVRLQIAAKQGTLVHYAWTADYMDPDAFLAPFLSISGSNRAGWKNEHYDEVLKKASSLPSGAERLKLYIEAIEILQKQDAVVIPLFHPNRVFLLSPRVKDFMPSPLGALRFRGARIQ